MTMQGKIPAVTWVSAFCLAQFSSKILHSLFLQIPPHTVPLAPRAQNAGVGLVLGSPRAHCLDRRKEEEAYPAVVAPGAVMSWHYAMLWCHITFCHHFLVTEKSISGGFTMWLPTTFVLQELPSWLSSSSTADLQVQHPEVFYHDWIASLAKCPGQKLLRLHLFFFYTCLN